MPETVQGRVVGVVAGSYTVETDAGALECTLRGRLRQGEQGRVVVGDRVRVERLADGSCRIAARLPRSSVLARRTPHGRDARAVVANVDQLAAVVSVARPDPDFGALDRILVLAGLSAIPAFIVANKADLPEAGGGGLEAHAAAGYPVVRTSAVTGAGLPELRERLAGRVTVLTGPSGVGKSSLANRLVPGAELRVGELSGRRGRGRQTTVSAALIPLPGGGYLADTPGFQFVGLAGVPASELAAAFPELAAHVSACRFADCRHREEPECAVRAAVESGTVSRRRYESYLRLLEEV